MQWLRLIGRAKFTFVLAATAFGFAAHAWEPTKPVEFIVPAGTGGGADQMARFIQGVVAKNKLSPQPFIVVNKSGVPAPRAFWTLKATKAIRTKLLLRCPIFLLHLWLLACRSTGEISLRFLCWRWTSLFFG